MDTSPCSLAVFLFCGTIVLELSYFLIQTPKEIEMHQTFFIILRFKYLDETETK